MYINEYDDIELDQKVKKVQDADRLQLNLNDESDFARLQQARKRPRFSPAHNPNFFDKRHHSFTERFHENFSDLDENQTQGDDLLSDDDIEVS